MFMVCAVVYTCYCLVCCSSGSGVCNTDACVLQVLVMLATCVAILVTSCSVDGPVLLLSVPVVYVPGFVLSHFQLVGWMYIAQLLLFMLVICAVMSNLCSSGITVFLWVRT